MKTIRVCIRLFYFIGITGITVLVIWLMNTLRGDNLPRSMRIRRWWAKWLLQGVGVRVRVSGTIPAGVGILVGNHRSYIDPILMLRNIDGIPVAKAELANWPMIGKGAKMAGILYLKREAMKSRAETVVQINEVLKAGFPVIIFPEGTTSGLNGTLPFRKGVFQLAARENWLVYPVSLQFDNPEDYWIDDKTFLQHAYRCFKQRRIGIQIDYGPPVSGTDTSQLLELTQGWINQQLMGSKETVAAR